MQQEELKEDKDKEEQRRLQDERDKTGKNGGEGGAAAGGITVAGSAVDGEPKCLQLGGLEIPWTDLTSWHGPLVGMDNNIIFSVRRYGGERLPQLAYACHPRKWE